MRRYASEPPVDELGLRIALNLAEAVALFVCGVLLIWMSVARSSSTTPGRLVPRSRLTLRRMMLLIAWAGLGMGAVRWIHVNFATVYASGYHEGNFRRIHAGMTRAEVESILGPPLRRDAESPRWFPYENWIYSDPTPPE